MFTDAQRLRDTALALDFLEGYRIEDLSKLGSLRVLVQTIHENQFKIGNLDETIRELQESNVDLQAQVNELTAPPAADRKKKLN